MFAMSITLKLAVFALGVLCYAARCSFECDLGSYIWVALKGALVPHAHPVGAATGIESTRSTRAPDLACPAPQTRTRIRRCFPRGERTPIREQEEAVEGPNQLSPLVQIPLPPLEQSGVVEPAADVSSGASVKRALVAPVNPVITLASLESPPTATATATATTTPTPIPAPAVSNNPAPTAPTPSPLPTPTITATAPEPITETIPHVEAVAEPNLAASERTPAPIDASPISNVPIAAPVGPSLIPAESIFVAPAEVISHVAPEPSVVDAGSQAAPEPTLVPVPAKPTLVMGNLLAGVVPFVLAEQVSSLVIPETSSPTFPVSSLVALLGKMSIQEQVEHEMEDWSGILEAEADAQPTMDSMTESLKTLELGMWNSVEELTCWNRTARFLELDVLGKLDATVSLPSPIVISPEPTSSMDLDAHETMDAVMEPPTPSYADTDMELETALRWTPPQPSVRMDWTFGVPNPWMGPTLLAAPVRPWVSEGHTPDVLMGECDPSSVPGPESEKMEGVVEYGPGEFVTTQQPLGDTDQIVVAATVPVEAEVEGGEYVEDIVNRQPQEKLVEGAQVNTEEPQGDVDELVDELAEMWTPAVVEDVPEKGSDSESEAEDDEEAELAALEQEHFAAAADDFLASLEGQILGTWAKVGNGVR